MQDKLALLTVVYNNYTILDEFFSSLKHQSKHIQVYISDLSTKKQTYAYPDYATVIVSENLGYSHGVNRAMVHALRDGYIKLCVVNSDIIFDKNFVTATIESLEKHPGTVIGGKIYYAPGFEYHTDRYTKKDLGRVLWYAGGTIDWDNMYTFHRGVDEVDIGQYDTAEATQFVTGCLVAFDKQVVDTVGFWDESYFLYYEDTDFCQRATEAGVPLLYDPTLVIWHKNAQSTDGAGSSLHQTYQNRNRLKFGLKYAPMRTKLHLLKNAFLEQLGLRSR
jgi:GT2 family glycosyltransferase